MSQWIKNFLLFLKEKIDQTVILETKITNLMSSLLYILRCFIEYVWKLSRINITTNNSYEALLQSPSEYFHKKLIHESSVILNEHSCLAEAKKYAKQCEIPLMCVKFKINKEILKKEGYNKEIQSFTLQILKNPQIAYLINTSFCVWITGQIYGNSPMPIESMGCMQSKENHVIEFYRGTEKHTKLKLQKLLQIQDKEEIINLLENIRNQLYNQNSLSELIKKNEKEKEFQKVIFKQEISTDQEELQQPQGKIINFMKNFPKISEFTRFLSGLQQDSDQDDIETDEEKETIKYNQKEQLNQM